MRWWAACLIGLLIFSNMAEAAPGEDRPFTKPSDRKTCGQIIAEYTGYSSKIKKSYALVVGISHYDKEDDIPNEKDPGRIKDYLMDVVGFDHVHLLTEDKVTVGRIRTLMMDVFPRLVDDKTVFFFNGPVMEYRDP